MPSISMPLLAAGNSSSLHFGTLFSLFVFVLLCAFAGGFTPWPKVRLISRAILFLTAILSTVLVVVMLALPFFIRRDSGIGSQMFWLMAFLPALFAFLAWSLHRGAVKFEKNKTDAGKLLRVSEDDRFG